jgi:hypothetical protein
MARPVFADTTPAQRPLVEKVDRFPPMMLKELRYIWGLAHTLFNWRPVLQTGACRVVLHKAYKLSAKRPHIVRGVGDVHQEFNLLLHILNLLLSRILILVVRLGVAVRNAVVLIDFLGGLGRFSLGIVAEHLLWCSVRADLLPEAARVCCIRLNHVHHQMFGVVASKQLETHGSPVPSDTVGCVFDIHVGRVQTHHFVDTVDIGTGEARLEMSLDFLRPLTRSIELRRGVNHCFDAVSRR